MADLADHTAATTASYRRVQADRGSTANPRYVSRYEKWLVGASGESGYLLKAEGVSNVSQAAADTAALAVLNAQRADRAAIKSGLGGSHTLDTH